MTFPFGIKNLDELYKNSESGNGGFFPLGKGVLWHSGIHINNDASEEFSPLLNGKVVMYRLSEDYKTVDLPKAISKNKFDENESYYGDFYKRSDNNKDEYTLKETPSKEYVSDCFIMLKHELNTDALNPSTFIFYTLYMNLEPALKSGLYEDTNFQVDGEIHVLSDKDGFSASTIGKPGLDKGHRYFDFVLILDRDLHSYSLGKSKPKDLFCGINSNVILYDRKKAKQIDMIQAETLFIPVHTQYAVEEYSRDDENFAKLVSLKAFRIYLKNYNGLDGECFKSGNEYVLKDPSKIWFSNGQLIDFNNDSSSLSGKEKYLYDLIKNDLQLLKGKNVTVVKVLDSGQPAIKINLSKEKKFWVLNDTEFFTQNGDGTIEKDCEIKAYSENPCIYEYAAIETTDELRKTVIDIENDEYTDCNGNIYYKAKSETLSFFVPEKDKNSCFKGCFDWDEWFFSYEPSDENSIRSENTSLTQKLIDRYEERRKKYGWLSIALSPWWGLVPYLTWKSLKLLYDGKKDVQAAEQMPIEYRKCICKHPIEWDASVIEKLYDAKQNKKTDRKTIRTEHIDYLKNVAKTTDIWKDGLSKIFTTNNLFFANPLYFISHLEMAGLFEFNPYAGKTVTPCHPTVKDRTKNELSFHEGQSINVKINPGFVPAILRTEATTAEAKKRFPVEFSYGDWNCATVSWEYHCPWYKEETVNSKGCHIPHTGIDLFGHIGDGKSVPIIALIHGRIWAMTTAKGNYAESYGRMMLIKGDNDYLYLLGHLENFNDSSGKQHKVGDCISPGNIVAYTGTTGFSSGKHLHLEIIKCELRSDEKAKNMVLDKEYNQLHELDGGPKGSEHAFLRFGSYWQSEEDWKQYRLNPLTGGK